MREYQVVAVGDGEGGVTCEGGEGGEGEGDHAVANHGS